MYRSFASNNSGDTLLVARFERVLGAESFVRDLFGPEAPDADGARLEWPDDAQASPRRGERDDRIARVGRTLLASGYHSEDALPELRARLWAAEATTVYSAIHTHDDPELVVGVRDALSADTERLAELGFETSARGALLLGHGKAADWSETLAALGQRLEGRAWSAELVERPEHERWADAMKHLDAAPWGPDGHLVVDFADAAVAARFASTLDGNVSTAAGTVLCDVRRWRPRLGQHATRRGGCAWWVPRGPLRFRLWIYSEQRRAQRSLNLAELEAAAGGTLTLRLLDYGVQADGRSEDDPHVVMGALRRVFSAVLARLPDTRGGVWIVPLHPVRAAARRVKHELRVLR